MSHKLTLSTIGAMSENDARIYFETLRWPNGPTCPKCAVIGEATLMESGEKTENKLRARVWNCRACREPFTVTIGTIFEGSHIPLQKWLLGFFLYGSSKKSLSALQLQRQLGLGSYRTAWHMAHRIRTAMENGGPFKPLTGIVEVDEVYIGGKPRIHGPRIGAKHSGRGTRKQAVQVLVQRDGGGARARAIARVDAKTLHPFIQAHVEKSAAIHSDEWRGYWGIDKHFAGGHESVRHGKGEYARGNVHTNTAESFNGLFKRSILGSWHHISREHINRYLDEQCFRWSHREESDTQRTERALKQADGVRLFYKRPKGQEGGNSLVASR